MAALELAVAQQVAELGRDGDLARMRPGELVGRGERHVRPEQRLDAHRRGHADAVRTSRSASASRSAPMAPISCVPLSSARPSFAPSVSGSRPASRRASERRHDLAAELHLAAADERQREVGERREVAGGADAALLGHDRVDARPQEVEEPVDDQRPAAAVAERERVGPQQEHRADDLARERRARRRPRGSSAGSWSWPASLGVDERRGQVAEAGRHAVDDGALGDEGLDDVARLLHPLARVDVERDRRPVAGRPPRRRRSSGPRRSGRPSASRRRSGVEVRDLGSLTGPRIVGYPRPASA